MLDIRPSMPRLGTIVLVCPLPVIPTLCIVIASAVSGSIICRTGLGIAELGLDWYDRREKCDFPGWPLSHGDPFL